MIGITKAIRSSVSILVLTISSSLAIWASASVSPYVDNNIELVYDGGSNFDTASYVVDSVPAINPGMDSSPNNQIVRANDIVKYYGYVNVNNSNGENIRVVYSITNADWVNLPQQCLTADTTPSVSSPVSNISSDKKTLTCNLGSASEGTTFKLDLIAKADSVDNNTKINLTSSSQSDIAAPINSNAVDVTITSAPKLDIVEFTDRVETAPGNFNYSQSKDTYVCNLLGSSTYNSSINDLCQAGEEIGTVFKYKFSVKNSSGSNFVIASPININIDASFKYLSTLIGNFEPRVLGCTVLSGNSTVSCGSGTYVAPANSSKTMEYQVDVNNIQQADLNSAGEFGTYQINIFVPQTNIPNLPSALTVSNLLNSSSFDPNDNLGVSNYGSNSEYSVTCSDPNAAGFVNDLESSFCNNRWDLADSLINGRGNLFGGRFYAEPLDYGSPNELWAFVPGRTVNSHTQLTPGEEVPIQVGMEIANRYDLQKDTTYVTCTKRVEDSLGNPLTYFTGELGGQDRNIVNNTFLSSDTEFVLSRTIATSLVAYSRSLLLADGSTKVVYNTVQPNQTNNLLDFDGSEFKLQFSTSPINNGLGSRTDDCSDNLGWIDWSGPGTVSSALAGNTDDITRFRIVAKIKANTDPSLLNKLESINSIVKMRVSTDSGVLNNWQTSNAILTNNMLPIYYSSTLYDGHGIMPGGAVWTNAPSTDNSFTTNSEQAIFNTSYYRSLAEIVPGRVYISKLVDKISTEDNRDELTYTITPKYYGPNISDNVTITDNLMVNNPLISEFVTNSLSFSCSVSPCTPIAPNINFTNNNTRLVITWNGFNSNFNLPKIIVKVKLKGVITSGFYQNSVSINAPNSFNKNYSAVANTSILSSERFSITKTVSKTVYPVNNNFSYSLSLNNNSGKNVGVQEYIDVLPYNGDSFDNTSRVNEPTDYNGNVEFVGIYDPAGFVLDNTGIFFTSSNPALINTDPLCQSNDLGSPGIWDVDGTTNLSSTNQNGNDWALYCNSIDTPTVWCLQSDFGDPGCPTGMQEVTAIRFRTNPIPWTGSGTAFPLIVELKATGNAELNVYTNNFSGRISGAPQTTTLDGQTVNTTTYPLPIVSNDVTIRVVSGSIGDKVWYDLDGDGIQDANEGGIPGVPVTLTWYGPDNTLGGDDDLTWTTTTDVNGNYLFSEVPSGMFDVSIAPPANLIQSYDSDGIGTSNVSHLTLSEQYDSNGALIDIQNNSEQDFGYHGDASISGTVWEDTNIDSSIDLNETHYFEGIVVELVDENNNVVATTTTDSSGNYQFTNAPYGNFTVRISTPSGYTPTTSTEINNISLSQGSNITDQNFGMFKPSTVSGLIFNDKNNNGYLDNDEINGFSNIVILLVDTNGTVIATTTTDVNGNYTFYNVRPGDYSIRLMPPSGYGQTFDIDGIESQNVVLKLTVGYAQDVVDVNFGYFKVNMLIKTGTSLLVFLPGLAILAMIIVLRLKPKNE